MFLQQYELNLIFFFVKKDIDRKQEKIRYNSVYLSFENERERDSIKKKIFSQVWRKVYRKFIGNAVVFLS